MAIKNDGTLWAWGLNDKGQFGNGNYTNSNFPVQVDHNNHWQSVAAGAYHTLAIKTDGTLWAWGQNSSGELGDGTYTGSNIPVQVAAGSTFKSLAASTFSAAIRSDGALFTWGNNDYGQLGDSTLIGKGSPVQVVPGSTWLSIALGTHHSIGIKSPGFAYAWGRNSGYQLGNGNNLDKKQPEQLVYGTFIQVVSAGVDFSLAMTGYYFYGSGGNYLGQLGDGTNSTSIHVRLISGLWKLVAAGGLYSLAIKIDGTLWSWGYNSKGQLGDGTQNLSYSPLQISNDNNWQSLSGSTNNSAAIKSDGSLWMWGSNAGGQVGDSTSIMRLSPVQVGCPASIIPPVITSFTPATASSGTTVNIKGKNFTGATSVSFGGTAAVGFTGVNDSTINAIVGTGSSGSVSITTPKGTGTKEGFKYCIPVAITSVTASANPLCPATKAVLTANGVSGTEAIVNWYRGTNTTSLGSGYTLTNASAGKYTATVTGVCGSPVQAVIFLKALIDSTKPTLTCPANKKVAAPAGTCTRKCAIADPVYQDNCAVNSLLWEVTGATVLNSPATGIRRLGSKTYNAGVNLVKYTASDASGNTSSCSFTVTVTTVGVTCATLARSAVSKSTLPVAEPQVRPNPSASAFTIDLPKDLRNVTEITVYNSSGSKTEQLKPVGNTIQFGQAYPKGLYMVEIRQGSQRKVIPVIKQ